MTVINSAELRNNMKKNETVVIQRGNKETFVLQKKDDFQEISSEVPDDFYRAITGKELISGIEKGLRDMIKRKKEQRETISQ